MPLRARSRPILALAAALRVWQLNERGLQQRRGRLLRTGGGDSGATRSSRTCSRSSELIRFCSRPFCRSAGGSTSGWGSSASRPRRWASATVYLVYELGRLLYGSRTGLVAALLMALMPYHVVVTRQVLLDGPMTLFATLTLAPPRAASSSAGARRGCTRAGAAMGLTFLSKETSIVLLCAVYAFLALTPELRVRLRDLAIALGVMALVIAPFPLSLMVAGHTGTGESYLTWQLFRTAEPRLAVLSVDGPGGRGPAGARGRRGGALAVQARGVVEGAPARLLDRRAGRVLRALAREGLPVPAADRRAAGGARRPGAEQAPHAARRRRIVMRRPSSSPRLARIDAPDDGSALAGSGGLPAGREAGEWIDANVPEGSTFMTIGPSMANLVQFYGHRRAYGLSVSPNPLNRNPSYEPLPNPDQALARQQDPVRRLGHLLGEPLAELLEKAAALRRALQRPGRARRGASGSHRRRAGRAERPAIVVYEVRP